MPKNRNPWDMRTHYANRIDMPKAEKLSEAEPDHPVRYTIREQESIYEGQLAYVIYDHKNDPVSLCWSMEQAIAKRVLYEGIADGRIERFYILPKRAAFYIYDRLSPADTKWIARSVDEATRVVERLNQAEWSKWNG